MNDVMVIGAGISGLVATRRLRAAGRHVTLLEARDRTGGRALSLRQGAGVFDLGPTWVWETEHHILALIRELGISLFDGRQPGADVYQTGAGNQHGHLPRSAVAEYRVDGGVQSVTDALAKTVGDITLGCSVLAIADHSTHLALTTNRGEYSARHVIAALPPRLLARTITVDDPHVQMWRRVPTWMADVAKVVATFNAPIWRESGLSGRAASTVGPMIEVHDISTPDGEHTAVFGFVPRQLSTPDLEQRVRDQLRQLFGSRAVPTSIHVQSWWSEPQTHSGDTEPDVQAFLGHPDLHRAALGGRLHLTSCETSTVSPGHLNGAVERALAVTDALLAIR